MIIGSMRKPGIHVQVQTEADSSKRNSKYLLGIVSPSIAQVYPDSHAVRYYHRVSFPVNCLDFRLAAAEVFFWSSAALAFFTICICAGHLALAVVVFFAGMVLPLGMMFYL